MTGARFARATRCRFFVYVSILVLMMGMLIIFHNSQLQLDEARQQRLVCEQQQETLNDRLSSLVEQKFFLEKKREQEQTAQLEIKRNLGQRIKDLEDTIQSEKLQSQVRYEKLEQSKQQLESKHETWVTDCSKAKEEQLQNTNSLERQLQNLQSELRKGKSIESSEINLWKEKYNVLEREMENNRQDLKSQAVLIDNMKAKIIEYQGHCAYQPHEFKQDSLNTTIPATGSKDVVRKSFQVLHTINEGIYRVNISEKTLTNNISSEQRHLASTSPTDQNYQSSSASSIGNLQIPKMAGLGVQQYKSEATILSYNNGADILATAIPPPQQLETQSIAGLNGTGGTANESKLKSMSSSSPIRKLPENVAPIPDNFEKLLDKSKSEADRQPIKADNSDLEDKSKKLDKSLNSFQIMDNEKYPNGGQQHGIEQVISINAREGTNEGDRPILDTNNLHNEVAADQGKEFGDSMRMDEADVDDGGDDDDYSNPSARKQEDQAVRN